MKKILIIAAFAMVVSLPLSFASGRFEIRTRPVPDQQTYQQQRDQQWQISQQNMERQRLQNQRVRQDQWQRAAWQRDMHQRNMRHQRGVTFAFWLRGHGRDYDNRAWDNNGRYRDDNRRWDSQGRYSN